MDTGTEVYPVKLKHELLPGGRSHLDGGGGFPLSLAVAEALAQAGGNDKKKRE